MQHLLCNEGQHPARSASLSHAVFRAGGNVPHKAGDNMQCDVRDQDREDGKLTLGDIRRAGGGDQAVGVGRIADDKNLSKEALRSTLSQRWIKRRSITLTDLLATVFKRPP